MLCHAAIGSSRQALTQAGHLLDRIAQNGRPDQLLAARLAPDMFPCAQQLDCVISFALRATFPLAGRDLPEAEGPLDLDGLRHRIAWAEGHLNRLDPADFDGAKDRTVQHRAGQADLRHSGRDYFALFALPNLWFHLAMAFAILRAEGLDIGKADFDGWHAYEKGFRFDD